MPTDLTVIPVIDLMQGQVVRGVRGERQAYRPIESALCGSSEPLHVATVLSGHCAARQMYIADLDALTGRPPQVAVLRSLLAALPDLEFWVDAGFAEPAAAQALLEHFVPRTARIVPVFASESLRSRTALEAVRRAGGVLSLDRRGEERLDPAGCWDAPALWPERLIVMNLERVGSGAGPDLETLRRVRQQAPTAQIIGAGGVRSSADLATARAAGADAWLVASALHDRQLPRARR